MGAGIGGSGSSSSASATFLSLKCRKGTPKNKWAGIFMTAFAAFGGILYG